MNNNVVVEGVVRGLLKGVSIQSFFVGLHNAFVHGQILDDFGYDYTDETLKELFVSFDALIKTVKKIR